MLTHVKARKARFHVEAAEGLAALWAPARTNEDVRTVVRARSSKDGWMDGWMDGRTEK